MHFQSQIDTEQEKGKERDILWINEGMPPKKRLADEKKGSAKGSTFTHPASSKVIERPHAYQEGNEIDKVLDFHWPCIRKNLCAQLFEEGGEHHESRPIVFKVIACDGYGAMLGPHRVGLQRV